jgi:ArsR family transcriptional regulator
VKELEQYFKALGDNTRLRILNLLLHGELCVCDIHYVLKSSQPLVSRHLAYLKNSGVVTDRREGYRIYYRLSEGRQLTSKSLFEFLRRAFKAEEQFEQDMKRLKEAIRDGACTVSEWKPYSALEKSRSHRSGARETANL